MKSSLNKQNSLKIFLLDAVGAFASIILLSMLYLFEEYFGMPKKILTAFIGIASVFFVYSTLIYFTNPFRWQTYLKIIAILNSCYCLFTIYQVILHFNKLTLYGLLYFVGEVFVIGLLSAFEFKIAYITKN
jgi:hypothetical protein